MRRSPSASDQIPFWRDVRVLRVAVQIVFVLLLAAGLIWLFGNLQANLARSELSLGFRFLGDTAGFPISEGIPYDPTRSNLYAFWVGVVNTLRVASIGIVCATLLGVVVGVARLSSNWLVRKLAALYVETLRNIPLLVQLFFWYFAVLLTALPLVENSLRLPGSVFLSRRGLAMPWPIATESLVQWAWYLSFGCLAGCIVYLLRRRQLRIAERPGFPLLWGLGTLLLVAVSGWLIVPGSPFVLELPTLGKFNFEGGRTLSTPFLALLISLSTYTGAFIAEIVRAGIQAVPKGQSDAAQALGLRRILLLRLVVLPQAMRVIIPPLGSQYLNLIKNSSLAILIGYYDLMNVSTTIFNQTGRAVEMILLIMASYLTMSLVTSALINRYNQRMRLVER